MAPLLTNLGGFLDERIGRRDYSTVHGPRGWLLRNLQILWLVARSLRDDRLQLRTARLSMVTLFSLVPLLALVFSVFKAFGGLQAFQGKIERLIYQTIAVGSQESLIEYLTTFVGNIHGGALGSLGGLLLLAAAVRLVNSIEQSFDELWGVRERRRLIDRVITYWAVITLGPLLLAASLAGSEVLQSWLESRFGLPGMIFDLVPPVLTVLSFSVLYSFLPSARVQFRHALTGGLLAGLLFEIAKAAYGWVAVNLFRYDAVFGSLGAVPVFIIWVEIAWTILLLGCKITFAYQNHATLRQEEVAGAASTRQRERLSLRLVLEVASRFRAGDAPPSAAQLARSLEAPVRLTHLLLDVLCNEDVLREAHPNNERSPGFVPARPPDRMTVGEVLAALRHHGDPELAFPEGESARPLLELLDAADSAAAELLDPADFRHLVLSSQPSRPDEPIG